MSGPDRVALIEGRLDGAPGRAWTYAEFLNQSEQAARALLCRFEPGDRIAVWAHNIPEWALLQFGTAMAGMVLVTVNPAYQQSELDYVLHQSGARALFTVDEHRGNPMLTMAQTALGSCPASRDRGPLRRLGTVLRKRLGRVRLSSPMMTPGDPVMIQYTSGTTGFPKGAVLHHRGLVNNGHHYFDRMGVKPGDTYITQMPLFHTAGSVMSMLGCIGMRCTQVLVDQFDPGLVLRLCEEHQVNGMLGVPTMLIALLEHPDFDTTDLSAITAVSSGGSVVPEQLVRTFEERLGAPFTILFGQTECSPTATMNFVDDSIEDKALTIGTAMPNTEVKIINAETGDTLPIGEIGELCVRGYHVMLGYHDMPDQTAEAIDEDGWLHTGDLAAMDDRGYCTIEGRLKDMIIRGGENIYPKELEEMLLTHPAVAEVAVVGLPDDKYGEVVGAFVRPAPGVCIDESRAVRLCPGAARATQDTQALDRRRRVPPHRLGQDPEVRPSPAVGGRHPLKNALFYADAMDFFGSKNGRSATVADIGPEFESTTTPVSSSANSVAIIARAMFLSRRGEWMAEVTLPTVWLSTVMGQNEVFGPGNGLPSIMRPTCLRVTPCSWIRRRAALPMKSASMSRLTSRSNPSSNGFVWMSASAW